MEDAPGRTLVAMSGGVDSSVAAALLQRAGHDVVGAFMSNGVKGAAAGKSCCSLSDARDARAVAAQLDIPFYVLDMAPSFRHLVDDFARDYAAGLTPNPCIVCNDRLKFGELMTLADDLGCQHVATGHYARRIDGALLRGVDPDKDQSYLLHGLTRVQLQRALFPLGALRKDEVREQARTLGLTVADKPDSADLCFVPGGDYRTVVTERLGHLGRPGVLRDEDGAELGQHSGIASFTVGQRRGLGVAAGSPRYVTGVNARTGDVVLGPARALERPDCRVTDVRWLERPSREAQVLAQLRQHHQPEPAVLVQHGQAEVELRFASPSRAVTPGQYAVFYSGERVLGGGRMAAPALPGAGVTAPVDAR